MEKHYLTSLFAPRSVAVVGASERPHAAGRVIMENLLHGGYAGEIYPVNPNHGRIFGRPSAPSVDRIGPPVDLAVITTPAATVPQIIDSCGRKGVRYALIISAGFSAADPQGPRLLRETLSAAKSHGVRILGPNCLGIMRPGARLDLTYSAARARPGAIALVSQSGALANALLDWAQVNDVGFSSVITLGDAADMTFGEILDYLVWDVATESILLYLEGIHQPRRFVSALRAAARVKPVIVVKTGRDPAGYQAAITHSGAMVGEDDVFDSVLRRAGAVRVKNVAELFSAARCLSSRYRPTGNRLAVVTNGGGPGILATDWAAQIGIQVPELAPATLDKLNQVLPPQWSRGNPADLCGGATAEHYREAIRACMEDPGIDGVLVILTPQAVTRPDQVADALVQLSEQFKKPMIACFMGGQQVERSRHILTRARVPTFRTPEPAVEAFSHISTYYRNQQLLLQVPYSTSRGDTPDLDGARMMIQNALAQKRQVLSEMESKSVLAAFRIPVARTTVARSVTEAIMLAEQTGFPVAMKVSSTDIHHKSDVGGVKLNIASAAEVRNAYHSIIDNAARLAPAAQVEGVAIEPMSLVSNGRELMVGIFTDRVFGPVIAFAAGGVTAEVMGDRAVCLPPLNTVLVRDLISRTRVSKLLGQFRSLPPVHMEALEAVLLRVSEMASELPWIRELDINPLIVDENGAVAVDARIVVDATPRGGGQRYSHMAICPYPSHLVQRWHLPDGTEIVVRPIRPEDAELLQEFVRGLSEESRYFRFISSIQELSPKTVARMTQIDYDREMALIAVIEDNGREVELGAARYVTNPDAESCEFALVVADAWHGRGIGRKLMQSLMEVARANGLRAIDGDVLSNNRPMLHLMEKLGFGIEPNRDDPSLKRVRRML